MPVVAMPDGTSVEFPDSMSQDQINSALAGWKSASAPQAQNNSWTRLPEMAGSALVKGAGSLLGLPGTVADLENRGFNALTGLRTPMAVVQDSLGHKVLPTVQDVNSFTSGLGLTDRPELTPTSPLERYGSAGIEALPSIAATVASGGLAAAPMAAASGEGGAMAAQAAHDLAPDSAWAPVVAGLVGGLGAGSVVGKVENVLNSRAAQSALTSAAQKLEDARNAAFEGKKSLSDSVDDVRAASQRDFDTTKNTLASDLTAHHAQQDAALETVASGLGSSRTLQDAGTALQAHARNWINTVLPSRLKATWAPVDAAIPPDSAVNLSAFGSALKDINSSAGALEPLATLLKPSAPKALGKALDSVGDLGELTEGEGGTPGVFKWQDVQKLRSTLGDAMSNPKVVNDIGAKNLERLYASLTSDMSTTAIGKGAGDLFSAANQESRRLYQIGEGPMSRIVAGPRISAEDPAPEAVAKSLLSSAKSGASDLSTLRQEIPQGVNELAAANLRLDPKSFARLPPESLGALVPNSDASATTLAALDAKDRAQAAYGQGLGLAQQAKAANIAAVQKARTEGNFAHASEIRNSSAALAAAKGKLASIQAAQAPPTPMTHGLLGSAIGGAAGVIAPHLFGIAGNDLYHGAVGDIVGAAAPYLYKGAKGMVKNPKKLLPPALGAVQGENQLQP